MDKFVSKKKPLENQKKKKIHDRHVLKNSKSYINFVSIVYIITLTGYLRFLNFGKPKKKKTSLHYSRIHILLLK